MAEDIKASDDTEAKLESKGGGKDRAEVVNRWIKELAAADKHEKDWRKRAEEILKLYRDEREKAEGSTSQRFNILYSNTEVLKGALYSQCPVPDVRRRFLDKNHTARVAAVTLNRALIATNDKVKDGEDFDAVMRSSVSDMVLPGRAVARVKYAPVYRDDTKTEVTYECVETEYVEWAMFRYSPAKRWKKVRWVAFGELLTRDDLVKQFGNKVGNEVELKWMPKGVEDTDENQIFKRALVWTIWNKTQRKVLAVSEGYKEAPLAEVNDPLKLEDFFPCPRPLYAISSTDTLIPVPEYAIYQDHALQLDALEERIQVLTDALRRRGVYDSSIPELEQLANAADNKFVPVKNYREFVEKGGLEQAFQEMDISTLAKVIVELMTQADAKKQQIYELIGISDIMRGSSEAQETLGAQKIKAQWGNVRVGPRQGEVQRFARDLMRLQAEIIAEHFSPQTLAKMTGVSLFFTQAEKQQAQQMQMMAQQQAMQGPQQGMPPQGMQPGMQQPPVAPQPPEDPRMKRPTWEEVQAILKDDKLRGFNIDIETDSTIKPQADDEQKNRVDMLSGLTSFGEKWIPAVQAGVVPKKLALELMAFGIRGFKAGSDIEEMIDEWSGGSLDEEQQQQADPEKQQLKAQVQELSVAADKNGLEREKIAFGREELGDKQAERQARVAEAEAIAAQKGVDASLERELRQQETGQRQRELEAKFIAEQESRAAQEREQVAKERTDTAVVEKDARVDAIAEMLGQLVRSLSEQATAIAESGQQNAMQIAQMTQAVVEAVNAEKEVVRDPRTGKAMGTRIKRTVQ